jgi:transcriptional regulator with XRE-family HTH domain
MLGEKIEPTTAFGRVLRQLRKKRGLTQEALSLEADVQRNFVSLIELGQNQPTVTTIFKLAAALGTKPSKIMELVQAEMSGEAKTPHSGKQG